MASLSHTIEAILYLKAKPLTIAQIAEYACCDKKTAQEALVQLMDAYAHREGALEIAETESGYSLQLRQPFKPLLDELIPLDIGLGALRTLAAIAMRGPISQTDLVDLRGSGAYGHVHDLVDQGFVRRRRQSDGRSFWIQVTEKFYQRFEIDKLPQINIPETSNVDSELLETTDEKSKESVEITEQLTLKAEDENTSNPLLGQENTTDPVMVPEA
ncbi:MAG: SMC-Scp complex subunit ScpB [Leptolyngbya sp. SIO3F4]|nr:SMC-Scp complex subunit ScpB [Leptolyngbya sp. SIO3F4]